jgi:ElaB/YqjD/DUF883 family membrane-anchored ribosome-binding protein
MQKYSGRIADNARSAVPVIMGEGRRLIELSARRAGQTATRVAVRGRRLVGSTVRQTERLARRNPWTGLGAALSTGFLLGGLCAFLFYRPH